jgi:hypothetical protein
VITLLIWAFAIILAPVAFSLLVAKVLRFERPVWVFAVAATILPAIPLIGGLGLFAWFIVAVKTRPPNVPDGGDGPAFFGIIFIAFMLPCLLAAPGIVSGFLAARIFRWLRNE